MGRDVARALAEAHERGVVHRYLSAQHVVFEADGHAKVVGFGLPMAADGLIPGPVAPELSGEGWSTSAADVFALGTVLASVGARDDQELAQVVQACTAADLTQRPSADELADRFERIAQAHMQGRHKHRAWGYALGGAACFVVGGMLALSALRPKPEPKRLEHMHLELPRPATQLEIVPPDQGTKTRPAAADR